MSIDDAIRLLEEARRLYGNLPVKVRSCSFADETHSDDCFDQASIEVSDATGMRMVVID